MIALHSNLAIERVKTQKSNRAMSLYQAHLKRKLLRGIHETNLELIRTQVHMEAYFTHKRQRAFIDVLAERVIMKRKFNEISAYQLSTLLAWFCGQQLS